MATRFYVNNTNSGITVTSWNTGWNKTSGAAVTKELQSTPQVGGSSGVITNAASGTSGHFTAIARFISPALDAQTISGTIKGVCCFHETNGTDNYFCAIGAKVVTAAGADVGVLLQPTASTSLNEFIAGASEPRTFRDASDNKEISLTSVACSSTDRIVVEIGFQQQSTAVADGNIFPAQPLSTFPFNGMGFANYDAPGSDNWAGDTWFQFSDDISPFTLVPDIVYIGSASTPADSAGATGTADPTAVTPPGDMVSGDLVLMIGHQRATGATLAVSAAGGQTWTTANAVGATNVTARLFWCIFNGTWSSDPSVDFSATTCNSVHLHVFRPPSGSNFVINQALQEDDNATAPHTITGQTTTGTNPTLTVAGWFTADDNTWGSISGTGWLDLGQPQYRNTSGSDQSATYAWFSAVTGGATGNVTKTQLTLGDDVSTCFIISWAAAQSTKAPPRFRPSTRFLRRK